jgi:hypothetical protein
MKAKVLKRLSELGAEIEFIPTEDGFNYTVDAPDGYEWNATAASCICGAYYKGQEKLNDVYQSILDDVNKGYYETNN